MKCFYDLHIHSALSPCAEEEMSPNNIVNMAAIKGLSLIAVTDHNTIGNVRACMEVGRELGVLVIPGMELQTREDVHLLCLFRSLDDAMVFESRIDPLRLRIPNKPERFGRQILFNNQDEVLGEYPWSLLTSVDISLEDAVQLVRKRGGIVIPCHLDRSSNSILSNLGFMPPNPIFEWVELSTANPGMPAGLNASDYRILYNSDAHQLESISEAEHWLDLPELTVDAVFRKIGGAS